MKKINLLLLVVAIACIITMFVLGYQGMHVSMAVPICIGIVFCTSTLVVILTDKRTVTKAMYDINGYMYSGKMIDDYFKSIKREPFNRERYLRKHLSEVTEFYWHWDLDSHERMEAQREEAMAMSGTMV